VKEITLDPDQSAVGRDPPAARHADLETSVAIGARMDIARLRKHFRFGTERTYGVRSVMSAFRGKAENICSR